MGFDSWKAKAKTLKHEIYALSLAAKGSRVPWYAKVFALLIIGYALSPVDIIPDFIPVLGYVDDLMLIPLGIILLIKMIPIEVMEECRERVISHQVNIKGRHWATVSVIVLIWIIAIYFTIRVVYWLFMKGK